MKNLIRKPLKGLNHLRHSDVLHVSGLVGTPDTVSEAGSMKSRSRRLPYLPPEEPAPLPTQAKKAQERMRYKLYHKKMLCSSWSS